MGEQVSLETTVADFIEIVKMLKLSNVQVKEMLDSLGDVVGKNIITDIFEAAGFVKKNKIFEPTKKVNYEMTLQEAIPIARSMRAKKDKQAVAKPIEKKKTPPTYEIIDTPPVETVVPVEQFVGRTYSNPFPIERPEEAQEFILTALGLTSLQLESIKNLIYSSAVATNPSESIYESIKQLGGRDRTNKTYYISKEIIERVADFAEDKSVKVSQFIEVALLDAIKKYQ